ncbi:hypothetical protein B0H14DRAFT_3505812 [Mycena olivaceomarginata]|nr:hypothetical protein B0H14DRAFT_3505812 [Mycena olivaceomarginata]
MSALSSKVDVNKTTATTGYKSDWDFNIAITDAFNKEADGHTLYAAVCTKSFSWNLPFSIATLADSPFDKTAFPTFLVNYDFPNQGRADLEDYFESISVHVRPLDGSRVLTIDGVDASTYLVNLATDSSIFKGLVGAYETVNPRYMRLMSRYSTDTVAGLYTQEVGSFGQRAFYLGADSVTVTLQTPQGAKKTVTIPWAATFLGSGNTTASFISETCLAGVDSVARKRKLTRSIDASPINQRRKAVVAPEAQDPDTVCATFLHNFEFEYRPMRALWCYKTLGILVQCFNIGVLRLNFALHPSAVIHFCTPPAPFPPHAHCLDLPAPLNTYFGGGGGQDGGQGQGQGGRTPRGPGEGPPAACVPPEWPLYIVEFKAGRTDLFFRAADRMVSARAIGHSPSLSMGLGLDGLGGGGVSPSEARGGEGADIRGGGAGGGGVSGKDWASDISAYFSPPRELNINTNLGGGGAGRGEFPQYEGGGGGGGGGAWCGAAPVSPVQRYVSAGQGQGQGSEQITSLSVLDILTARSRQGNQAWEGGEAAGGGDLEVSLAASREGRAASAAVKGEPGWRREVGRGCAVAMAATNALGATLKHRDGTE